MPKKVIALLCCLVVIVVAIGGFGAYYCLNLNRQITALASLQTEADRKITGLQDSINGLDGEISSLAEKTASQINSVDDKINTLNTKVENLAIIDVDRLYQKVENGVVKVITEVGGNQEISGSGFIFDPQGHVITAYHVVEGATRVDVILNDGTISSASITGYSQFSDVAVLKLDRPLAVEALVTGDSNATDVGKPVIAIGSPFDLRGTVTLGIVSQKNRFIEIESDESEPRWVTNLIQCDAAANFGNSGGPLINSKGEVIGLVIARVNPDTGDGICYAVSSNKFKRVALAIIDHGSFDYPWLGVQSTDLDLAEAQARRLDTINGVLVAEVTADSPAALAGIRVDDIVVAIDGIEVQGMADLTSYLGENKSPNESITLTLLRNGRRLELTARLGKMPS
jgi:2-alkenal reductase